MKITVTVKPCAKVAKIEVIGATHYRVSVKEPATENKANLAVLKALSKHLDMPISRIKFVRGMKGKEKIIEIS